MGGCGLAGRTVDDLLCLLRSGAVSSRALVEEVLDSIAADGSAYVHVAVARARADADASDRQRLMGAGLLPLSGVPISIKDLFDVAGEVTTAGSERLRSAEPAKADAVAVAKLRAAGAIIVGRTHMSEFAFSGLGANPHFPVCANPYDRGHVPGGSSSGAAVSVARGQAAIGLGTDTGGSVRIPASFCGLVGFKPTQARISRDGVFPLSPSLDSVGPIGNSVACCALVDQVLAGMEVVSLTLSPLRGMRLAIPQDLVLENMEASVALCFEQTASLLSEAGAEVETVRFPHFGQVPQLFSRGAIVNAEAFALHARLGLLNERDRYDPNVMARIEIGERMSVSDINHLFAVRRTMIAATNALSAGFDALILPTTPIVAPRFSDIADSKGFGRLNALALRNTSLFNFLDRCAVSIPMPTGSGLPAGLMIVGEHMRDSQLLSVAHVIETVLRGSSQ